MLKTAKKKFPRGYLTGLSEAIWETSHPPARIDKSTLRRIIRDGRPGLEENVMAICEYFDVNFYDATTATHRASSDSLTKQSTGLQKERDIPALVSNICSSIKFSFEEDSHWYGPESIASWLKYSFVDLNFLEVSVLPSEYSIPSGDYLLTDAGGDDFDRVNIRQLKHRSTTSIQVIEEHKQFLLYGAPGAGKSSYLQWLALQCRDNAILEGYVPLFLEGSKLPIEDGALTSLLTHFEETFERRGIPWKDMNDVLESGQAFFIIDGIDEISPEAQEHFLKLIYKLLIAYEKCRFVISARLACKITLKKKLPTLIIDAFNSRKQIPDFINFWFSQSGRKVEKAQLMIDKLRSAQHKEIREIARKPVLLRLLCHLFDHNGGKFPPKQAHVFDDGIKSLVRRSRTHVEINAVGPVSFTERDIFNILCDIAVYFFQQERILFRSLEAEHIIQDYCSEHLNINKTLVDGDLILTKIQEYNGLIVHKAQGYCAFAHLTYQEFFVAYQLVRGETYNIVLDYIFESRWKFVIELVAELLMKENKVLAFFRDFKQTIDRFVEGDSQIREFLRNVDARATQTIGESHNPSRLASFRVRAWYFTYAIGKHKGKVNIIKPKTAENVVLPNMLYATSLVDDALLDVHARVYDIYHCLDQDESNRLVFYIEQLIDLIPEAQDRVREALRGWLRLIPNEIFLNGNDKERWWQNPEVRSRWKARIKNFMENLKVPHIPDFTEAQIDLLEKYYEANFLFSNCLMRSSLSLKDRKVWADRMLSITNLPTDGI